MVSNSMRRRGGMCFSVVLRGIGRGVEMGLVIERFSCWLFMVGWGSCLWKVGRLFMVDW